MESNPCNIINSKVLTLINSNANFVNMYDTEYYDSLKHKNMKKEKDIENEILSIINVFLNENIKDQIIKNSVKIKIFEIRVNDKFNLNQKLKIIISGISLTLNDLESQNNKE